MTSCQEWTLHLLLSEFYDLFSSSNFKKILEIGNHVREWEWWERAGERDNGEREAIMWFIIQITFVFIFGSIANWVWAWSAYTSNKAIPFCHSTRLLPPPLSTTSATAGSPQELEERLLARCSAVRVQTINPLWPKWNQAQLRLESHFIAISNCPCPPSPTPVRDPRLAALETSTAVNASKWWLQRKKAEEEEEDAVWAWK